MAKTSMKIVGIKPSTVAMYQGVFMSVIGFAVAVMHTMTKTFALTAATDSVLKGMSFGLAIGIVSIVVVPLVYFGIGWLLGYLNGWIINAVMSSSGGIEIDVEK